MAFIKTNIRDTAHPLKLIADDWALLSAGITPESTGALPEGASGERYWNAMTVSWGGVGRLWNYDVVFAFVRPQRYTYEFMEQSPMFSLSFGLPKDALTLCGKLSGRDTDKLAQAGLQPHVEDGGVFPESAAIAVVCRKIALQDFTPAMFLDPLIENNYPDKDYHRMYIGEILGVYQRT